MYRSLNRNNAGLSPDAIRRVAPSVLTCGAQDERLSERYAQISTGDIIDGLVAEGYIPVEARQSRVRSEGKREFARHMVRMRHHSAEPKAGTTPEIILTNSHDGTASFRLMHGFYRLVCSNGMVAFTADADVRIKHTATAVERAKVEADKLLEKVRESSRRIEAMQAKVLTPEQQRLFAMQAARLRWDEDEHGNSPVVFIEQLLTVRRREDRGDDLWKVFNRVQENVIRGGTVLVRGSTGKQSYARGVESIDADIKINAGLWQLADEVAEA